MANKLGYPPARRHIVENTYDKSGKLTNTVICWTCTRKGEVSEDSGHEDIQEQPTTS
jgi:hypothetical protein